MSRATAKCDGFPSVDEIESQLLTWTEHYPQLVDYQIIGASVEGRPLNALRISSQVQTEQMEPEIRIIGGIHGNECQSVAEVLHTIEWLLWGYDTDTQLRGFVDSIEFTFVPLINPDGYNASPAMRTNANFVDINRNFGFGWSQTNLFRPFSEPESRALRELGLQNAFVMGLSYHTLSNYVNGPWNYSPFHPLDEELIDAIGLDYAGTSDYQVVFGWDWYQISGDLNDWSLGTAGTLDWTIELTQKDDLVWDVHEPALRSFFAWALRGVKGVVTDAETGVPLHAMITVEPEGAPVFTDVPLGDYHRVLLEGAYEVTAWAPGYQPMTLENVWVAGAATRVDFALQHNSAMTAGFQISEMTQMQDISNAYVEMVGYENETVTSDALGMPDGYGYALGKMGSITIDMGEAIPVADGPGDDLWIVSSLRGDEVALVSVAAMRDGPYIDVALGSGDILVDLALSDPGFDQRNGIRFVKITDQSTGITFNEAGSGYDLDAVVNLSHPQLNPDVAPQDSDTVPINGSDDDTGTASSVSSTTASATATSGAAAIEGCSLQPKRSTQSLFQLF
ncbi:MAG: hypothetical protein JXR76_16835 [Deltaproteobacteria bacterium]|nr:hypothetical protein [Deltaproteobacteria bacterium]